MVEFQGKSVCLAEACELAGLSYDAVQKRISDLNWDVGRALSTPVRAKAANGEAKPKHRPMTNATGYKGVKKRRNAFLALIMINGKRRESKQFPTAEEAHEWYLKMKKMKHAE